MKGDITFKPSEDFANYLLDIGMKETTRIHHPEHHKQILENGYSTKYKRRFSKKNIEIVFDYINIVIYKNTGGIFHETTISEPELNTILNNQ